MTIINQDRDGSIAERHFQMGLCTPALIFINVTRTLMHMWHTLTSNTTCDLYRFMSISKRAVMQNVLFRDEVRIRIHDEQKHS